MKKQDFRITGSLPLLEAISKELIEIGYKWGHDLPLFGRPTPRKFIASDGNFIWAGDIALSSNDYTFFSLPKDYNEALEYAKQLLEEFNTPKFEVGKWYSFDSYKEKCPNIAKCSEITDSCFSSNEWIMVNNIKRSGGGVWKLATMHNVKELSIDDIQQYLPEDHPDKKFVPKKGDCIYHDTGFHKWIVYFRETREENSIYGGAALCIDGHDFYKSDYNNYMTKELRLATSEEKRWLDACIEAGKYLSKGEALAPKHPLSDCIRGEVYWSNNPLYLKGHIWRFDKIENKDFVSALSLIYTNLSRFEKSSGLNDAHWNNLRLATKDEIKWLEACEKANRFISKKRALKTKEELLLEEAIAKYPIGTKFYDFLNKCVNEVTKTPYIYANYAGRIGISGCQSEGVLYFNEEWADIIDEKSILIEEAKKRFPIGTKFHPAHMIGTKTETCIVTNDNFTFDEDGDIYSLTDDGKNYSSCHKYGNTNCDRIVYYQGKWAEIIPAEEFAKTLLVVNLPFGETMWNINREKGEVSSVYGTITKTEIASLMKKIKAVKTTKLLGYNCKTELISVGCQKGTYEEIEAIYNELTR